MAHLTCVKHGKRSVVLMGDRVGAIQVDTIVRHRTNHDSYCDSHTMLYGGKIIHKHEVFNSSFDSGVAVAIADIEHQKALIEAEIREMSYKDRLKAKFSSSPLKRIRGRV